MNVLHSAEAPKAIGPYSQAVQVGNLIFCSGQTPIDPQTMELEGKNVEEQTERVLSNLSLVLKSRGLTLSNVIKANVFLISMKDFAAMNKVYEASFGDHRPARTTVQVSGLPMNALVEIECIAEIP